MPLSAARIWRVITDLLGFGGIIWTVIDPFVIDKGPKFLDVIFFIIIFS
ncbi:MAG: hypothetical protein ACI9BF_000742 [Candidatus Paceibacteria bacterium]|jgi:hypothetical protein